ncbi:MAG: UDP-N-acetylmuramoyl-L-alanyl-D-glutamate--2,6-diaminopimelate ligase [Ruminococcaceae bacterium]|nr:UDP-N-acetylmuramoyl-L-alanyl-D-glutamate--2,6-diaminopimelate ligase [Oscillospiraceae bacterium]
MLYNELFKDIKIIKTNIAQNLEITALSADSRKISEGTAFVCIKGAKVDAHTFIPQAVSDGAVLCVVQQGCEQPLDNVNYVMVEDTREAFALLLANFYGNPQRSFKYVIGVTGTNGKSSTTFMLKRILEQAGYKVGLIGTVKYMIGDREYVTDKTQNVLTTPDSELLFELMSEMRKENVDCLVMEVSSHAIALNKICGMHFNIAVFTNLSRDHLDFHGDMEAYRDIKAKLFENCDIGIFNNDDVQTPEMKKKCGGKIFGFALKNLKSDFMAKNIRSKGADGTEYELLTNDSIFRIKIPIPGDFSVYNSLAAASCAYVMGVKSEDIAQALVDMPGVPGRICKLDTGTPFSVIIDFAHTPDGLQNILNTINGFKGSGRSITLFGCGGDRDRTKRPLMGKVAMENSDYCIITSDNSRSEEKSAIIADILTGIKGIKTPHTVIENRTEAIEYAIDMAKPGDIILLAGKGHEEYEIDKTGKHPYSETEIVMRKVGKL